MAGQECCGSGHEVSEGTSSINVGTSNVDDALSSSTRSVFEALRAPPLTELTQKRSVHCNPPPKGKRSTGQNYGVPSVSKLSNSLHL